METPDDAIKDYSKEFAELTSLYKSANRYEYYKRTYYPLHYEALLTTEKDEYYILIVGPHEGNGHHWIQIVNPCSRNEGWNIEMTDCLWEYWFDSFEELKENIFNWESNIEFWENKIWDKAKKKFEESRILQMGKI